MDCIIENGACVRCQRPWAGDPNIHRNCRPPRSEAQREALLAICRGCEHFQAVIGNCSQCGCRQIRENLLSERLVRGKCPAGKW